MRDRLAWGVLGFNILVVVWGAYVRASGSGAGCGSHWPLCNGAVVPRAPTTATLVELSHRVTSGLALLAVVALFAYTRVTRPAGHPARRAAAYSLGFMLAEALIGAGLVLLALVAHDASLRRVIALALHLVNTFLLLASLALTALWSRGERPVVQRSASPLRWLAPALLAVLFVGVSGAVTALGDTLFPARDLASGLAQDFSPTAHALLRVRVIHPTLALLTGLYLLLAVTLVSGMYRAPRVRWLGRATAGLFVVQLGAGLTNLLLLAPTWMQLVHLLLADLVWLSLVLFTATAMGTEPDAPETAARDLIVQPR